MLTSTKAVRAQFWREWADWMGLARYSRKDSGKPSHWRGKAHNDLPCDVRVAFVDWLDQAVRQGQVSERLAQSVTL